MENRGKLTTALQWLILSPPAVHAVGQSRRHPQQLRALGLQHRGELGNDLLPYAAAAAPISSALPAGAQRLPLPSPGWRDGTSPPEYCATQRSHTGHHRSGQQLRWPATPSVGGFLSFSMQRSGFNKTIEIRRCLIAQPNLCI